MIPLVLADKNKFGKQAMTSKKWSFAWEVISHVYEITEKEAKYVKRQCEASANSKKPREVKKNESESVSV
jgi:hypothetical protein